MSITNRQAIQSFRKKVQEQSPDSTYTNQFLYRELLAQAPWLIKREIAAGRIYQNNSFFQPLGCQQVVETSTTEDCCPVKTNCRIYRLKDKLPEMWVDNDGPVIRTVTSVDRTTEFKVVTYKTWQAKRQDPYQKMGKDKYCIFSENYLWFPEYNPHRITIEGFFTEDIQDKSCCSPEAKPCTKFLDKNFPLPDWLFAEAMSKALQLLFPTKQLQEDSQIDKNSARKN